MERKMMEGAWLCAANYQPLTPISFLQRASVVYPDRQAIVSAAGDAPSRTWRETWDRCSRLAAALANLGVQRQDVVAVFAQNIPALYELHFAVPMAGAVICALNASMDAGLAAKLLQQTEPKVVFVDAEILPVAEEALRLLSIACDKASAKPPLVVLIKGMMSAATSSAAAQPADFETLVMRGGSREFAVRWPEDENDPIAISFTSGTTGVPKGVIYSHRGSYLNSLYVVIAMETPSMPKYLWAVPMAHCTGWCMTWGVAAHGGTNVFLPRKATGASIIHAISRHGVTHMGGAAPVLSLILDAAREEDWQLVPENRKVTIMTAPPPTPTVLSGMEKLGFVVVHSYGMTETYSSATVCTRMPEWDELSEEKRAEVMTRQGLQHLGQDVDVKDPATMVSVPSDGVTVGEVMFRGNTVMSGYYKNKAATKKALAEGWFRTGDYAVRNPGDKCVMFLDRSQDIIVAGGEKMRTNDVEKEMSMNPAVAEVAVVARPADEHMGETPVVFVALRKRKREVEAEAEAEAKAKAKEVAESKEVAEAKDEVRKFCMEKLAGYKLQVPVQFVNEIPKTATGKVNKSVLREMAKVSGSLSSTDSP